LFWVLISAVNPCQGQDNAPMNLAPHPRLMVGTSTWADLKAKRKQSPVLDQLLQKMEADGRALLEAPPLEHKLVGRRLLETSRTALKRIMLWSFDYRITGDKQFKDRAEQEMLGMAAFPDWNPSHFLDVGEMTAAMAIGYDWLYDVLSPASRTTIREAIVEKGLKQGLDPNTGHNSWYRAEMNWNQVCIGGLSLGALAIAEDEPLISKQILANARQYSPN
jgi:hypothetical protein